MNLPIKRLVRAVLVIAGAALAYFATGHFLLVLGAPPNGAVITVWLPSGISVAVLILVGPFAAIGSFIGSLALELKMGTPLSAGLMVGMGNAVSELPATIWSSVVADGDSPSRRSGMSCVSCLRRYSSRFFRQSSA